MIESIENSRITSRVRAARIAPIGSIRTPSASSTVESRERSGTRRSSGFTTVGPVTVTSAPNSAASDQGHSMKTRAAMAASTAVTATPTVTRLRIGPAERRRRRNSRLRPPSKRMMATASWTM